MGKQIRYFMLNEDQVKLVDFVKELSDMIVDNKGIALAVEHIYVSNRSSFYILSQQSKVAYSDNGFIEAFSSDVIQLSKNMIRRQNQVEYGRLWVELKYYDSLGNIVTKDKWLSDKYNMYKKWIIKNCRISKEKDFYIGEATYKLYKSGEYKMMATPVTEVEFD